MAAQDRAESPRWSLPRGRVLRRALRSDPTHEYVLYVPESAPPGARVLVSVHGISRNFLEQTAEFASTCDEYGAIMLAPIFTTQIHDDYQRLGRRGRGIRADLLLHELLIEVASLTGADVSRFHLFGFSAGAQFGHRYLMAHPHRVARAALAAAGWYTFPDNRQRFPYGIRPTRKLEGVAFNPEEFLRVPVQALVGECDTTIQNLRQTDRCNEQQGRTRLERAQNWVDAMREAAIEYGLEPLTTLSVVPGIDHSFANFCARGQLAKRVGRSLFGSPTAEPLQVIVSPQAESNGRPTTPNGDPRT